MDILVLNGSPKGEHSITLHTAKYLAKCFKEDYFEVVHVAKSPRKYERVDVFEEIIEKIKASDLILFVYPIYTSVAPYQVHAFIDKLKNYKDKDVFKGKLVTQITTSKHFYDVTAHKYIEENSYDLGCKVLEGLSADMEDLLSEKGRETAVEFWKYVKFSAEHNLFKEVHREEKVFDYQYTDLSQKEIEDTKIEGYDTVILTNVREEDKSLKAMIQTFSRYYPYSVRIVNINDYTLKGGCLGCLRCTAEGKCIYKDDFAKLLKDDLQTADATIHVSRIENHYIGTDFKMVVDRQFSDGHRTLTMGMPIGYMLSGDYSKEANLATILEGRSEVAHHSLMGIVSDESRDEREIEERIRQLAFRMAYALENKLTKPQNFLGVGGAKIFRDMIYITGGLMREDHRFYKKHGFYDFPQKQMAKRVQMCMIGSVLAIPSVQQKIGGQLSEIIAQPYKKIVDQA